VESIVTGDMILELLPLLSPVTSTTISILA
jgi:hypothetical protein